MRRSFCLLGSVAGDWGGVAPMLEAALSVHVISHSRYFIQDL